MTKSCEHPEFESAGECVECGLELGYENGAKAAMYEDQFATPRFWVDLCEWEETEDGLVCEDCHAR